MEKNYTILVCEDDESILKSIDIYLKQEGYNTVLARNGREGVDLFFEKGADLIIMDLMMPVMTGEEAIIKIREKSYVPVIILSAKGEDYDKIIGLNIGADDYVTKPFNPLELIARVNSSIRRYYNYTKDINDKDEITIGDISLSKKEKTVYVNGEKVDVTGIEYKILELLMSNPGRVFSTDEIYERVWNEPALDAKTVTVHIRRIREKIELNPKIPLYLKVAWGLGYKFVNPEEK